MQLRLHESSTAVALGDQLSDVDLLRSNPHSLLLRHQETIAIIVKTNIRRGLFSPSDYQDVVQAINEGLIKRFPKMQLQFKGVSTFKTYLSRIIQNLCLSIASEKARTPPMRELNESDSYEQDDFLDNLPIQLETRRLQRLLNLYQGRRKAEVTLSLKMYYRLAIQASDLNELIQVNPGDPIELIVQHYDSRRLKMTDKEMYSLLTPILNRAGNRESSDDAKRKWVETRIGEILQLLNGKVGPKPYDKEHLRVLVENCFSPFPDPQESI